MEDKTEQQIITFKANVFDIIYELFNSREIICFAEFEDICNEVKNNERQ